MILGPYFPALEVTLNDIFFGALWGFILSLPISLFLAFWMSEVKNRWVVVLGAFIGGLLGFLIVLGFADTLIFDTPLPGANGTSTFFGSVLFCSALALVSGIIFDLIVARRSARGYRRQAAVPQ